MKHKLFRAASVWYFSGIAAKLAIPAALVLAMLAGEGSLNITWGNGN